MEKLVAEYKISIHAPRTGSDLAKAQIGTTEENFNPRSPHGERLIGNAERKIQSVISIHAPRTGSDVPDSTALNVVAISIHAPRTGSDGAPYITNGRAFSISIHAPRTGSDHF